MIKTISDVLKYLYACGEEDLAKAVLNELSRKVVPPTYSPGTGLGTPRVFPTVC